MNWKVVIKFSLEMSGDDSFEFDELNIEKCF